MFNEGEKWTMEWKINTKIALYKNSMPCSRLMCTIISNFNLKFGKERSHRVTSGTSAEFAGPQNFFHYRKILPSSKNSKENVNLTRKEDVQSHGSRFHQKANGRS